MNYPAPSSAAKKSTPPPAKPSPNPDLQPPAATFLVDPNIGQAIDAGYEHPKPAGQTNDPNRLTIKVPSEKTVLSLGKGATGPDHINDDGITGRTESHLHFQVNEPLTTLVMGLPAKDVLTKDSDQAAKDHHGFTVVTEGYSWNCRRSTTSC